MPSFSQWQKLPRILSPQEKIILGIFLLLSISSFLFLIQRVYIKNTRVVPAAGGHIVEGVVGSPRFLNPVYSDANDVDRDLVQLLFSGLFKYNAQGELVPDLADQVTVREQGRIFEISLKENARWNDGHRFSADDVVFTVQTIQDPRYKSPSRANWVGVKVEKLSDFKVRFELREPYAPFLERLTLKIIPVHIWQDIGPENFALSFYNLQPVSQGPYLVSHVSQEKSGAIREIQLKRNTKYHGTPPFVSSLTFKFFDTQEQLEKEVAKGSLTNFHLPDSPRRNSAFQTYELPLPRYFALFFNLEAENALKKDIRHALAFATNKEMLVAKVFQNKGAHEVRSPVRADLFNLAPPQDTFHYNPEKALELFKKAGYEKIEGKLVREQRGSDNFTSRLSKGSQGLEVRKLQECLARDREVYPEGQVTGIFGSLSEKAVSRFQEKYRQDVLAPSGLKQGTGVVGPSTRTKLNELCSAPSSPSPVFAVTLTTLEQDVLVKVAQEIKAQWEELGMEVRLKPYPLTDLERDIIKPRNYEVLLFGEILGKIPDPFPFWHSSQKRDPGLNLSSYESKKADQVLESARREMNEEKRQLLQEQLQDILLEDLPALVLYDIPYKYVVSKEVRGIQEHILGDPSERFSGVETWYIKEGRKWNWVSL